MVSTRICCDTSFLFSFYATDVHTPEAKRHLQRLAVPITITLLNEFELINALLLAEYRKLLTPGTASTYLTDFQTDIGSGTLLVVPCDMGTVVAEAKRLSSTYTLIGGYRGFDILHVAAALDVGATEFLSFDANQRKLARIVGLKVRPS